MYFGDSVFYTVLLDHYANWLRYFPVIYVSIQFSVMHIRLDGIKNSSKRLKAFMHVILLAQSATKGIKVHLTTFPKEDLS